MYRAITENFFGINQRKIAELVGINEATISRIINKKQTTSKMTAYCIVKAISSQAELNEYFTKTK